MHNASIAKSFPITERVRFTFTSAFTNLFNHPNFRPPASNISNPGSVGVINNLREGGRSRRIELRGRIDF
jgi:hypothetical protein